MAGGINRAWLVGSGSGERGVNHMLNLMAGTARRAARNIDVRCAAEYIIGGAESYLDRARLIHDWIVQHIKYVPDPIYTDAIRSPLELLAGVPGDCDDLATLDAALLGSIGIQSRVQAVGFGDPEHPFSHVFVQVKIPQAGGGFSFLPSDPTPELNEDGTVARHYGFAEEPPGIMGLRKARDV